MRSEQEMMELILSVARSDRRIKAVVMSGSRADSDAPKDKYRDYDICYYVDDAAPFYGNHDWVIENFGKPLIVQSRDDQYGWSETDTSYIWLMIFPDGNRVDLSVSSDVSGIKEGEPNIILLNKDGFLSPLNVDEKYWHIKPPNEKLYYEHCNEFWWCLNNVAKGIARDELPYAMEMLNHYVRETLNDMVEWYIGTQANFSVSTGKIGKWFKRYLPPAMYARYAETYALGNYDDMWRAIDIMCALFHELALKVAEYFKFNYRQHEEDGMREYMRMVRDGEI